MRFVKKKVGSTNTYKSTSISQSRGKHLGHQKQQTRHVDGGVSYPRVHGGFVETMRFEKHRGFKKDIQIQIGKPKKREILRKSNTRHVDGGGSYPRAHGGISGKMQFEKNRRVNKDIQIQIRAPKLRETPMKSKP